MDTTFVKLPPCGGKTYFLLTHQKEKGTEGFDLTLTDGDKFWEGQLTEEDLDALCSNLKMDFKTFVSQTVMAFTRQNMTDVNFVYQLKQRTEGIIDFLWKQEVGDIKILMGSATLHQTTGAAKDDVAGLFTSCIKLATQLQQKIHALETDNLRLAQERLNALKRLDKCVSAKEELENDLFAKFTAVLNSKKEHIRSLLDGRGDGESMEDKQNISEPVPPTSGNVSNSGRSQRKTPASQNSPPSDHDEAVSEEEQSKDTDDETPPRKRHAPMATGAKMDSDTSLNLGDDDDDVEKGKGVVRRPARQGAGKKRQTPAKPVLPKVSSSRSSDGGRKTPLRASLRKSGSGNSEQSVENVDTDILLNDF